MDGMTSRLINVFALVFAASVLPLVGGELTKEEISVLKADVDKLLVATQNSQIEPILKKTHPVLFEYYGGKEKFRTIMANAFRSFKELKVKFLERELKDPTETYDAGEEEVCFLPHESVLQIGENKVKSVGFMCCIRKKTDGEWFFLDGAGVRNNEKMLWKLIPKLDKDVKLPANTVEIVTEDPDPEE